MKYFILFVFSLLASGCMSSAIAPVSPVVKTYYIGETWEKNGTHSVSSMEELLQMTIWKVDVHEDGTRDSTNVLTIKP